MERVFSKKKGVEVVIEFLVGFWMDFLKKEMVSEGLIRETLALSKRASKHAGALYDINDFFYFTVCHDSEDYFEKVIEDTLQIPLSEQPGMQMQEQVLFQLAIDFCCFMNKRFAVEIEDSLRFTINWLEDMRDHPEQHQKEWKLWNEVVIDVMERGARP